MTMPTALPFGIRDIKIIPYTDMTATALSASMVDLPYGRTLSWTESEDFEDMRGDDQLVTTHGSQPWAEWELEAGGISLEALQALNGGLLTVSGVSPNVVKRYRKRVTDQKPWFCLIGQSMSDSGGDMHTILYRCRVTDKLEGSFEDQSFFATQVSGKGLGSWRASEYGTVYDFVNHQTIAAIAIPVALSNEIQQIAMTGPPTAGTFTATFAGQTTAAIPYNATSSAVQTALENLPNIEVGDVVCTNGPLPGTPVVVTFGGLLAAQDVGPITVTGTLTGGTVSATTTTPGGV